MVRFTRENSRMMQGTATVNAPLQMVRFTRENTRMVKGTAMANTPQFSKSSTRYFSHKIGKELYNSNLN